GGELVLLDINRASKLGTLFNPTSQTLVDRLLSNPPRRFSVTVVANTDADRSDVVARTTPAGETSSSIKELGLNYPPGVFSLSHVALPFPKSDSLYGMTPDSSEDFGIHLGNVAARGETGALIVRLDSLLRMSSNPFFPYLSDRVVEALKSGGQASSASRAEERSPPPESHGDDAPDPADDQWLNADEAV